MSIQTNPITQNTHSTTDYVAPYARGSGKNPANRPKLMCRHRRVEIFAENLLRNPLRLNNLADATPHTKSPPLHGRNLRRSNRFRRARRACQIHTSRRNPRAHTQDGGRLCVPLCGINNGSSRRGGGMCALTFRHILVFAVLHLKSTPPPQCLEERARANTNTVLACTRGGGRRRGTLESV